MDSLPLYEKAAWLTLKLAFCGTIISLIVGLICNVILYFKIKGIDIIVKAYIGAFQEYPSACADILSVFCNLLSII
jgi:polar amino acid transport system permease protein